MPQFEDQELQSQMQVKFMSEKGERSQRYLWGGVFNWSHIKHLRDFQIISVWDISETLGETSSRYIWDAAILAGIDKWLLNGLALNLIDQY